jgi:hypothetical protein
MDAPVAADRSKITFYVQCTRLEQKLTLNYMSFGTTVPVPCCTRMHVRSCVLHSPFAGQPLINDTKLHLVLASNTIVLLQNSSRTDTFQVQQGIIFHYIVLYCFQVKNQCKLNAPSKLFCSETRCKRLRCMLLGLANAIRIESFTLYRSSLRTSYHVTLKVNRMLTS